MVRQPTIYLPIYIPSEMRAKCVQGFRWALVLLSLRSIVMPILIYAVTPSICGFESLLICYSEISELQL